MAKYYKGSLNLDWYNKRKSIITTKENVSSNAVPAPKINWINKDNSLFYEIDTKRGLGIIPYWVDESDLRVKETRPLKFIKAYKAQPKDTSLNGDVISYKLKEENEDDPSIENFLIKGDNLLALNSIKYLFRNKPNESKSKCIYIDPPYNIGKAFEYYDDNLEHSEWLTLFRDRVRILKELLVEGGYIFVQLDDSEGAYGKLVLDEIFGRQNYVVTIYVQVRYDDKTLKEDMDFNKLIEQIHVYRNHSVKKSQLNKEKVEYSDEKFNIKISELGKPNKEIELGGKLVQIFYDDNYKIEKVTPNKKGLKEIWASGSILDGNSSGRFFRDYLSGRVKEDGLKILYKVYNIGEDGLGYRYFTGPKQERATRGKYFQGIPLEKQAEETSFKYVPISNFIDLASYFGNCRHEGGVDFKSGKKPEILIQRLIELATSPGDLVIDCFGGSGTTFAVAHKMKRKWIGIEIGEQADTHIIKRMKKVLRGEDNTKISKEWDWSGGGAFRYYHLGPSIINFDKDGKGDFNWELGNKFIEQALLNSYDYNIEDNISFDDLALFNESNAPAVGKLNIGNKIMIAVCSLFAPDNKNEIMSYDEIYNIYITLKNKYSPETMTFFTNRGIEIALDSKPDDLEIIKVPQAIFAELER